ncbi:MAG: hypothetical protein WCA92_05565 [Terriglobales bacterium]
MGDMGWNEEVLIEPATGANHPVRIMVLCMTDVGGKTQRLAFSKTIDAQAEPDTANGRDGALKVTVNVLNVAPREVRVCSERKNEHRNSVRPSSRYWMDSLPCMSNRRRAR